MFSEGICGDGAAILKDGVTMSVEEIVSTLNETQELERGYSHQLGELARLSDIVCTYLYTAGTGDDAEVMGAVTEIMQYVNAVRPEEHEKKTSWVMHILGPDDVIPCRGEFDALRRANQHNKQFAKLMANDPSPNDPYCVALAESV